MIWLASPLKGKCRAYEAEGFERKINPSVACGASSPFKGSLFYI